MDIFFQLIISGISLGALYAMVALGFVVLYKATGILNFAHGQFLMLGAYLATTFTTTIDVSFALALFLIAVMMGIGGAALHRGVMRRMVGAPLFSVVLLTIGVSIVIEAVVLMTYGADLRGGLRALPQGHVDVAGVPVGYVNLIILGAAVVSVVCFIAFFLLTRTGLQMRALAENIEGAAAMGVNADRIYMVAWGIAAMLAGVGGVLYSNATAVIDLALPAIGLRAFPAALVGGLDSVRGAIIGGLLVGVVEQLSIGYLGAEWQDFAAYGIMFIVLMIRPHGLFGGREVVRV